MHSSQCRQVRISLKLLPSPKRILYLLYKRTRTSSVHSDVRSSVKSLTSQSDSANTAHQNPRTSGYVGDASRQTKPQRPRDGRSVSVLSGSLKRRVRLLSQERRYIKYDRQLSPQGNSSKSCATTH
jgi:hypothetical protein